MKVLLLSAAISAATAAQAYYVAPLADGNGWPQAFKQAQAFVGQMTLEEKVNLTVMGNGVPRLGFLGYQLADGSGGPAGITNTSAFSGSVTVAASLDRALFRERGQQWGMQYRKKGYHGMQGPNVNLMRSPQAGRNFENYGPEPYLTGEAVYQTVQGVQSQQTFTVVKHYAGNEQEHGRWASSSNIDDKTFHEMYEWPFAEAVRAGTGGIMAAYNAVNNSYCSESPRLLGDLLKGELDFQGLVESDFMAARSGPPSLNAGLDTQLGGSQAQPVGLGQLTPQPLLGQALVQDLANGEVTLARINDAATRIMTPYFLLGQNKVKYPVTPNMIVADNAAAAAYIRKEGAASTVLLKNTGKTLPLKKPKHLALFGIDAGNQPQNLNGPGQLEVAPGVVIPLPIVAGGALNGTLAAGFGSAYPTFPYLVTPLQALTARAKKDGSSIVYVNDPYNTAAIKTAARQRDTTCIAFASSDSGEEIARIDGNVGDRNNITSWFNADQVIRTVAANCPNTIVVVHAVGPILMDWADLPNVKAIVFSGLPGQESGNSLVDVLYGAYNPSGKLPFTIAYKESDYPAMVDFSLNNFESELKPIDYTEGVFLDYRHFDAQKIKPRYPFGFGLSYTSFSYCKLEISKAWGRSAGKKLAPGGPAELYDVLYTVSIKATNTGKVAGNATPQLYIGFPSGYGEPPKVMRGFEKAMLKPGQEKCLSFPIRRKDISVWDVKTQKWIIPKGKIQVFVGESSRDIRASGKLC